MRTLSLLAWAGLVLMTCSIKADENCGAAGGCATCEKCGCNQCQPCCKLVCEMKKVKTVKYCCKCEDFCTPHETIHDRTETGCNTCQESCDCGPFSGLGSLFCHDNSIASCADQRTKVKLYHFVVTKEVPTYKWVTVNTCPRCGSCGGCGCSQCEKAFAAADAGQAPVPPTPAPH